MFQISVASLLCYLRESLLPRTEKFWYPLERPEQPYQQHSHYGLYLRAELSMADFGYAEDGNTKIRPEIHRHTTAHFLFCRNTSVFVAFGGSSLPALQEFENTSNHDSCWREGVESPLNQLYFRWAKEVAPHLAPKDVHQFNSLDFCEPKYVEITHEAVDPHDSYLRRLVKVKILPDKP